MKIEDIKRVKIDDIFQVLKSSGLVIMPTETVYGAFVNATDPKAVEKLTKYKARPFGKPYSVAVASTEMAIKYVEINDTALNLYKNFLPGPLTIISKGKHKVASGVESETGTLGIRIPDYKLIQDVVGKFGRPITATSANASYKRRPYKINDVLENLSEKQKSLIDLIVDAGELPHNEPSTVIDTTLDDAMVLRQGDIKFDNNNQILSKSPENTQNFAKDLWQKYEQYAGTRAIVFALEGPMGAGKTVFTKGLAKTLEIKSEITSPTFDLEHEYLLSNVGYRLSHIDAWRMQTSEELKNLGFAQNITDKSVVCIEWAERVGDEIRKYSEEAIILWVIINYGKNDNERIIEWGVI